MKHCVRFLKKRESTVVEGEGSAERRSRTPSGPKIGMLIDRVPKKKGEVPENPRDDAD